MISLRAGRVFGVSKAGIPTPTPAGAAMARETSPGRTPSPDHGGQHAPNGPPNKDLTSHGGQAATVIDESATPQEGIGWLMTGGGLEGDET